MNSKTLKYLALGDSYTIGEGVEKDESFPNQLAQKFKKYTVETTIIATTGWTSGELIEAFENYELKSNFDFITLLIGVNNQYRKQDINDFISDYNNLILKAINFAGGNKNKVFLISIPDYGFTPFGADNQASITNEINLYNTHSKQIAEECGIKYFDITTISRLAINNKKLIAFDNLHPSGEMYKLWVDSFYIEIINQF